MKHFAQRVLSTKQVLPIQHTTEGCRIAAASLYLFPILCPAQPAFFHAPCLGKLCQENQRHLGAAAGLGAKGLVPACAVDVVIPVPLELEQHHVGQPVGSVPAVLEPDRLHFTLLVSLALKLLSIDRSIDR